MGPSPSKSSLKDGIVAVAKRSLDATDEEKTSSLKRPHFLTSSKMTNNTSPTPVVNPTTSLPQNLAGDKHSSSTSQSDQTGASGMVIDHQPEGDGFKTSHQTSHNISQINRKDLEENNKNGQSGNKHPGIEKKVSFEPDVNKIVSDERKDNIPPSPKGKESPKTKFTQVLKLAKDLDKYDICEDLRNTRANVTFGQILNMSNQSRMDLSHNLKRERFEQPVIMGMVSQDQEEMEIEVVNNPYHDYISSKVEDHDIAVIHASLEGKQAFVLVDACSNTNLVSRKFLDRHNINYEIKGKVSSRIQQAMINDELRTFDLVELQVKIGHVAFPVLFRISDNPSQFYDAIIGLKVQHDHRIIVDPVDKLVCLKTKEGNLEPLAPIVDINTYDSQCFFCYVFPNEIKTVYTVIEENTSKEDIIKYKLDEVINVNTDIKQEEIIDIKTLETLFNQYTDVIACSTDDLQRSKLRPHHIELMEDTKPIKSKVRKMSQVQLKALKEELTKLLNKGLIVPSNSPWASPIVMVPKSGSRWRLCSDYRKVNKVTVKDAYSIPNIREAFESMTGSQFFSALDLYSGYHQIPMLPEDQDITAITTKFGNFNYVVMPFGLTNAPATFQREMNRIFFTLLNVCVQVYLDDIIIYSPSFSQHLKDLEDVFRILRKYNLKINIEKCKFCRKEIEVLGHLVSTEGLRPIESKVKNILNLTPPTSVTELRSYLGMIGYYREFIENFASIMAPLYKLLRKNVEFIWDEECDKSFHLANKYLVSAPILSFPRYDIPFIIRSDASFNGIGGVLLQLLEDGVEHPIKFVSRSLKKSERNYSITELEGTAAHYCLMEFRHYILGNPFVTILYTDHLPLVPIIHKTTPQTSKHARWINDFSQNQVEVRYQPGKLNKLADALSRMTLKEDNSKIAVINTGDSDVEDDNDSDSDEEPLSLRIQRIKPFEDQTTTESNEKEGNNINNSDKIIVNNDKNNKMEEVTTETFSGIVLDLIKEEENDNYMTEVMKSFLHERFITIDDQLFLRDGEFLRKVIDEPLEKVNTIARVHKIAHEGIKKTYERIRRQYYWKNMTRDIKKYVTTCKICQLKKAQPSTHTERYSTPVEAPLVRMAVDIIGPLKRTRNDNEYIIVAVDYFTKWPEAKALSSITSEDVTNFFSRSI